MRYINRLFTYLLTYNGPMALASKVHLALAMRDALIFLWRVSILMTRDIDIAIPSVRPPFASIR